MADPSTSRRFVTIARRARHVTDIDVKMIVGFAWPVTEGLGENLGRHGLRESRISPDLLFVVQPRIADSVNVRRSRPVVRSRNARTLVRRRAIAAIRADKNRRIHFLPERLQI